MNKCKWCGGKSYEPADDDECFGCWALRVRIEKNPEIARRMLAELRNGTLSDEKS